jgi:hypothetical protein
VDKKDEEERVNREYREGEVGKDKRKGKKQEIEQREYKE